MTALHIDWRFLCTSICYSIERVPLTDFDKVVVFVNERVLLQLQTYQRRLPISYMLQYDLFGNNFNKVEWYKIKRTPRTSLFHIASMGIAKQIFNVGDLCSAKLYVNNNNNNNDNNMTQTDGWYLHTVVFGLSCASYQRHEPPPGRNSFSL